ncbi:bifunctional diaminohydroxyphosphoribosylaminopyrimidine deaminase/5-amino-6-(5-phosphoribosylamino)uracil reductase RibD [Spiribacter halobius]|uniref:Riboflavin biosynthesis protein RibD n=2 Tax=Sediminicurvatus halobius TaxID=2182432 RepID=A0A2U2MZK6_9GAMM|nr:bifunctional diaminohydroxyphosphoribosylaminopyrimidine deaminase/5-amino-6-(5-phosphoribosylamino)uracil reductase RibD [Spiribacter halobius]UEX79910.1 bifunctional diaminohydroxyphosphoribosylaminopyrimidine deaminase/5-amino-6-(5-phosphoribosylamino)uracil reductase RibD [Spiribacter halobius]
MARALRLAERGRWTCDPNPRVGCVLVRDGEAVGEGWHERAGGPHAEVLALEAAGAAARGATAYVTLEPCSHYGRTPPCADALIEAGVARVVIGAGDPNPRVGGRGVERLREAGVAVAGGLMAEAAEALNAGFMRRMRGGLPWVRCKVAASLDGRTAMASGESRWITSAAARRDVHRWRAASGAIVTGVDTVIADDPRLTARDVDGPFLAPRRVVLDSHLRTPTEARLLRDDGGVTLLHVGEMPPREQALVRAGAHLQQVAAGDDGRVELTAALRALAADEVNEVLVEAGPTLSGALLQAGLVDELIIYLAPHLMGHEGRPLLALAGLEQMSQRLALTVTDQRRVGEDLRLIARLRPAEEG